MTVQRRLRGEAPFCWTSFRRDAKLLASFQILPNGGRKMVRAFSLALSIAAMLGPAISAQTSAPKPIHHYVFFGGDWDRIKDAKSFLENRNIEGAQVIYTWRF